MTYFFPAEMAYWGSEADMGGNLAKNIHGATFTQARPPGIPGRFLCRSFSLDARAEGPDTKRPFSRLAHCRPEWDYIPSGGFRVVSSVCLALEI